MSLHASVFERNNIPPVFRLVHQDGSLADLTMLSASSVEAALPREEAETQEKQEEQEEQEQRGKWQSEEKEEEALVVVMCDAEKTGEKPGSLSDPRQSSTEESHHCSAKTEPEPSTEQSTEQSSGTEQAHSLVINHLQKSMLLFCCSMHHSVILKYWFWRHTCPKMRRFWVEVCETHSCMCNEA